MSASKNKTIGFIFLGIIILLFALQLTPLILMPFGVTTGFIRHIASQGEVTMGSWPNQIFHFTLRLLPVLLVVLWIFVIIWVYRDAESRKMNGILWALLVFVGSVIGLIIYLIVRSDILNSSKNVQSAIICPGCERPLDQEFAFCPHCGRRIQSVCPKCEKPVEDSWSTCPYCGVTLSKSK